MPGNVHMRPGRPISSVSGTGAEAYGRRHPAEESAMILLAFAKVLLALAKILLASAIPWLGVRLAAGLATVLAALAPLACP